MLKPLLTWDGLSPACPGMGTIKCDQEQKEKSGVLVDGETMRQEPCLRSGNAVPASGPGSTQSRCPVMASHTDVE